MSVGVVGYIFIGLACMFGLAIAVGRYLHWRQGPYCVCGHGRDAHEHYRAGTECVDCDVCPQFRRG
jgi:hypothetical protein